MKEFRYDFIIAQCILDEDARGLSDGAWNFELLRKTHTICSYKVI